MNQEKQRPANQFLYLGRWVSKDHFRVMVYNTAGQEKLVNTYDEFIKALEDGEWFASKELATPRRKQKNGANG